MSSHNIEKRKNWRHLEVVAGILISIVLVFLAACPAAFAYYFKQRFYPNTFVAGVNVSRMTLKEAKNSVGQKFSNIDDKKLTIKLVDKNYIFLLHDFGVNLEYKKVLDDTFANQRNRDMWRDGIGLVKNIIYQNETNKPAILTLEKDKVNSNLDGILSEVNKPTTDAVIRVSNNQLVIDKEVYGVGVDKIVLERLLYKNLRTNADKGNWQDIQLTFQASPLEPKIKESDLEPIKTQTEEMIKKPILLTFEDKKFTFTNKNMINWIKFETKDGKLTPIISRSAVMKDVIIIAKKVDIKPVEKRISSVDGSVIQEGKDGRFLAKDKLVNDIMTIYNKEDGNQENNPSLVQSGEPRTMVAALNTDTQTKSIIAMQVDTKTFTTKTMAPPFTPGMYPGKYVEVNLSNQTMYLWEGLVKIKEYRVSSGKRSTPTREGIFKIKNKAMVGKSYPWIMPYWMAFAQDRWGAWQGFHELPVDMRTGLKEGIRDIGHPVSHGCVRLAVGNAKALYNWAEVGMPVYIHR